MSKIALTPSRDQLLATNGSHNRIVDHGSVRAAALKDFAGKKISGPEIGRKYSINKSLVYVWSKTPEIYGPLGFSEKDFSHRRMAERVKKEPLQKELSEKKPRKKASLKKRAVSSSMPFQSMDQQIGPVRFCPNCACDIRAVAIAMKMSS